jgi:iron uptake system EfeUOB component EfeO/EfeM
MKKTIASIALLCAVGLTAAGCGSDDDKTLSAADLKSKAEAICTSVSTDQQKLASASKWDEITPRGQKAMDELRALTPPDDLKDKYTAYLDAQQKLVDESEPLAQAMKANDAAKAQELQTSLAKLNATADAAAVAAGIPACGSGS